MQEISVFMEILEWLCNNFEIFQINKLTCEIQKNLPHSLTTLRPSALHPNMGTGQTPNFFLPLPEILDWSLYIV